MADFSPRALNRRGFALCALLALSCSACSTTPESNPTRSSTQANSGLGTTDTNATENREVHTELVRSMLAQGQYYAALAHIEELKRNSGDTRGLQSLEADARRKLGQTADAQRLYNGLLNTEFDGEAHHGLGLIAFKTERAGAVQHLRKAVQRRPTDAQFRNDLGYALMETGAYKEAMAQLSTAVELNPADATARNNLVVLLILNGDESRAKKVVQDSGLSEEVFAGLRRRAQALNSSKAPDGPKR